MLSLRLKNDFLEMKFESFLGAKEFKYITDYLKSFEGAWFNQEKNSWMVPKHFVDEIDSNLGERIAWHHSLEDIKGIHEVVLPKFEIDTESLSDMKLPPFPFQMIGISFLHDIGCALLADEMGLGKAQPLDANILTGSGWMRMADVYVGDWIIGSNGKHVQVIGVFPQGEKDIYRVNFSDGSSTECCDEHLWAVNSPLRRWRGAPYKVHQLSEIREHLKDASGNRQHFIPMVEPIDFIGSVQLPIHPYLMGYLLGNGGLSGVSTPVVTIPDQETYERLEKMLPEGSAFSKKTDIDYRIVGIDGKNPVLDTLREFDLIGKLSYEKGIPYTYKFSKLKHRIPLFQGLLDSDGHVRPEDNNIEFSSSSKQLAQDVSFLAQSLGGTAPVREKETTHRVAYRMSIALPREIKPFLLSRKANVYHPREKYLPSRSIESIEYVGRKEAQCIKVDAEDQLYVTDDCIVTHNTPQAIGAAHRLYKTGKARKALVVCPSSLKYQWGDPEKGEITKFTDYQSIVIDGTPKEREAQLDEWQRNPEIFFAITNYELVRNDIDQLRKLKIDIIIVDEIHRIKNWASKTSQAMKLLDAPYKFGLTGTPVQNRPEELYNIMDFLNPTILGNFWSFRNRYVVTGEKFGQKGIVIGYKKLGELRKKVARYMLRRMKIDVAPELPEMIINDYYVEMTTEQQRLDERLSEDMRELLKEIQDWHLSRQTSSNPWEEEESIQHPKQGQSLGFFTMMLEVCDSPELLAMSDSGMAQHYSEGLERKKIKSPKLDEIEEIAQDQLSAGNNKIVIFTQFARMQKLIVERLSKIGKCEILNGSMKPVERQAAVDRFKYDEDVNFFVTTDAGNYGINLQFASVLIHTDLPWNPAIYDQRCGRIHRIGSSFKEVNIINLITRGGIDERIQEVMYKKRELSNQLVEKNDQEKAEMNKLTAGLMNKLLKKPAKKKGKSA